MKPRFYNNLKYLVLLLGFIITQGCGGTQSGSNSLSSVDSNKRGVTISNEVASPSEMGTGDIMMLQFGSDTAEFDFDGVDAESEYYLAVGSIDYGYGTATAYMQSSESLLDAKNLADAAFDESEKWQNRSIDDAFQQSLRNMELATAMDPEAEIASVASSDGIGAKAAISSSELSVGDTEELNVLNSLTSSSVYTTVTARVKCITDNVVFYVDTEVEEVNPDDLPASEIKILCQNFHDQVDLERSWFGYESDVNDDDRVAVLLTPQVNRLGSMGGGIITGFFLSADLYSQDSYPISNEREIVYALVPDSGGYYRDDELVLPKNFTINNLLTAVLPHELQHVISYNQHVFEGEGISEESWLNEGLSHLVEDLVGYGQENYKRVELYLSNPGYNSLVTSSSPDLAERGASYLFMRFLYEQHPNPSEFLWNLYHSNTNGVANIEAAYNGASSDFDQFGEFFMRWMVTLSVSNRGITQDERYTYAERTYNDTTENWEGMCLYCVTEDGRGTTLTGPSMSTYSGSTSFSIYKSSMKFYRISTPPESINFTSSSSEFGAALIRIK